MIGNYILLEGGISSCTVPFTIYNSTTYVDAKGNDTFEGPPMTRTRQLHCSIQVDSSTIVLTGGNAMPSGHAMSSVVQYSQLAVGKSPTSRELPDLNRARAAHACGWFIRDFEKVKV